MSFTILNLIKPKWQALADEYKALTGQTLVIPTPVPPAPPAPGPESNAQALWDVAGPWCKSRRTRPDLVALKAALMTWAAAEGLSLPGVYVQDDLME